MLYAPHERPVHPFIEQMNETIIYDQAFTPARVRRAIAAYFGMVTFLDHNIGRLLGALRDCGLAGDTRVIYTSDHGDNLGNRGFWGKSNLYEDAAGVPLIMAGPMFPKASSATNPCRWWMASPPFSRALGWRRNPPTAPFPAGTCSKSRGGVPRRALC